MKPRRCATCPTTNWRSRSATLRKDLFGLRFANATGELEKTAGVGARDVISHEH